MEGLSWRKYQPDDPPPATPASISNQQPESSINQWRWKLSHLPRASPHYNKHPLDCPPVRLICQALFCLTCLRLLLYCAFQLSFASIPPFIRLGLASLSEPSTELDFHPTPTPTTVHIMADGPFKLSAQLVGHEADVTSSEMSFIPTMSPY
jgi:hypothetical protein